MLSGRDNVPDGQDLAGLLFECAPDSAAFRCGNTVVPLVALVGDFAEAKRKAFGLARKLLQGEPPLRGIRQLAIFEELVIRELQRAFHSIHLHGVLQTLGIEVCRIASNNSTIEGLRAIQDMAPGSYRLRQSMRPQSGGRLAARVARVLNRLRGAGFSAAAVQAEWRQLLNAIDPYHRRTARPPKKDGALRRGGIWFYSTAYTFTRAGMMYEPFFPERFTWLVESPHTGGKPLVEERRDFVDVHAFGESSFHPPAKEIDRSREEIVRHLEAVDVVEDDERLARELLLGSRFIDEFLKVHLSKGLYFSALFESLLDAWRPRAVVVGNPVFEGYLLHQARKRRIPTVLLQHGILGDYCQLSDPPVDAYIVRGAFWREFLAQPARQRAVVLNPSQAQAQDRAPEAQGRHILFVTAPYSTQEFFNELDLDEILRSLLSAAAAHRTGLLVRVHPMETVDYYRRRLSKLNRGASGGVDVRFSHGPGLEQAVRDACVAVTYCSTVFLDCLRAGVPIVSFEWHDFSFKRQIGGYRVFHYAQSLADLEELVGRAIMGKLRPRTGSMEPFLANSSEVELRKGFARICGRQEGERDPDADE